MFVVTKTAGDSFIWHWLSLGHHWMALIGMIVETYGFMISLQFSAGYTYWVMSSVLSIIVFIVYLQWLLAYAGCFSAEDTFPGWLFQQPFIRAQVGFIQSAPLELTTRIIQSDSASFPILPLTMFIVVKFLLFSFITRPRDEQNTGARTSPSSVEYKIREEEREIHRQSIVNQAKSCSGT